MNKLSAILYAVSSSVVLIVIWAIASYGKLVSPIFLPTPTQAIHALIIGIQDKTLLTDVASTTYRFLTAFFLAIIIGTPIGILMGTSNKIYRSLECSRSMNRACWN